MFSDWITQNFFKHFSIYLGQTHGDKPTLAKHRIKPLSLMQFLMLLTLRLRCGRQGKLSLSGILGIQDTVKFLLCSLVGY